MSYSHDFTQEELYRGVADRGGQFVMVPFEVIDAIDNPKALALWVYIRKFANHRTGEAFLKRKTLAKLMGYKDAKSVDKLASNLRELGLLDIVYRFQDPDTGEIALDRREGMVQISSLYVVHDRPKVADGPHLSTGGVGDNYPPPRYVETDRGWGTHPHDGGGQKSTTVGDTNGDRTIYNLTKTILTRNNPPNPPEGGTRARTCNLDDVNENRESENFVDARANQRKEANSTQKRKAPERIPEDWRPSASSMKRWRERWPEHESRIRFELEDFHAYWLNAAGKRAKKINWDLAATNWLKNAFDGFTSRKPKNEELSFSSLYGEYVPTPEEDLPF